MLCNDDDDDAFITSRCFHHDSRRREAGDEGGEAEQPGDDGRLSVQVHGKGSSGETCREEIECVASVCMNEVFVPRVIYNKSFHINMLLLV